MAAGLRFGCLPACLLAERGAMLKHLVAAESRLAAIGVARDVAAEEAEGVRDRALGSTPSSL